MCVELMLNAVTLTFVTFSRMLNDIGGQSVVVFVLVVAAAEVVVGLAIIVALLRKRPGATADDRRAARGLGERHHARTGLAHPCPAARRLPGAARRAAGGWASRWPAGWPRSCLRRLASSPRSIVFAGLLGEPGEERHFAQTLFEWLPAGGLSVDLGFLVDPLSITMALFVTGVGHADPPLLDRLHARRREVLEVLRLPEPVRLLDAHAGAGQNLLVTFLGWEGVGACSYFLISFWFTQRGQRLGRQEGVRHQPHR